MVGCQLWDGADHAVVHDDGVALRMTGTSTVAIDPGTEDLMRFTPSYRPGDQEMCIRDRLQDALVRSMARLSNRLG